MKADCCHCTLEACQGEDSSACPLQRELRNHDVQAYLEGDHLAWAQASARVEAEGYTLWPRLREALELAKRMGYTKVGLAFCVGLKKEARLVADYLSRHGLAVASVQCKTGGIPKEAIGLSPEEQLDSSGVEVMCNPLGQAQLLNDAETQWNLIIGLCLGHDALFTAASKAPVSTLIAKDRVFAHNPAGAVYTAEGYSRTRLEPKQKSS